MSAKFQLTQQTQRPIGMSDIYSQEDIKTIFWHAGYDGRIWAIAALVYSQGLSQSKTGQALAFISRQPHNQQHWQVTSADSFTRLYKLRDQRIYYKNDKPVLLPENTRDAMIDIIVKHGSLVDGVKKLDISRIGELLEANYKLPSKMGLGFLILPVNDSRAQTSRSLIDQATRQYKMLPSVEKEVADGLQHIGERIQGAVELVPTNNTQAQQDHGAPAVFPDINDLIPQVPFHPGRHNFVQQNVVGQQIGSYVGKIVYEQAPRDDKVLDEMKAFRAHQEEQDRKRERRERELQDERERRERELQDERERMERRRIEDQERLERRRIEDQERLERQKKEQEETLERQRRAKEAEEEAKSERKRQEDREYLDKRFSQLESVQGRRFSEIETGLDQVQVGVAQVGQSLDKVPEQVARKSMSLSKALGSGQVSMDGRRSKARGARLDLSGLDDEPLPENVPTAAAAGISFRKSARPSNLDIDDIEEEEEETDFMEVEEVPAQNCCTANPTASAAPLHSKLSVEEDETASSLLDKKLPPKEDDTVSSLLDKKLPPKEDPKRATGPMDQQFKSTVYVHKRKFPAAWGKVSKTLDFAPADSRASKVAGLPAPEKESDNTGEMDWSPIISTEDQTQQPVEEVPSQEEGPNGVDALAARLANDVDTPNRLEDEVGQVVNVPGQEVVQAAQVPAQEPEPVANNQIATQPNRFFQIGDQVRIKKTGQVTTVTAYRGALFLVLATGKKPRYNSLELVEPGEA